MASALVLRIKFPQTYPIIYKTVRLDGNMTVPQALAYIAESLHVAYGGNVGLYLPDAKLWLDPSRKLSDYGQLYEEGLEYVEYKDREQGGCNCCKGCQIL